MPEGIRYRTVAVTLVAFAISLRHRTHILSLPYNPSAGVAVGHTRSNGFTSLIGSCGRRSPSLLLSIPSPPPATSVPQTSSLPNLGLLLLPNIHLPPSRFPSQTLPSFALNPSHSHHKRTSTSSPPPLISIILGLIILQVPTQQQYVVMTPRPLLYAKSLA